MTRPIQFWKAILAKNSSIRVDGYTATLFGPEDPSAAVFCFVDSNLVLESGMRC